VGKQRAIGVTNAANGATLYIATTGPPYPVALTQNGTSSARIVLDRWNEPVALAAPANALDITKLQSSR
jgi:hypothetical protein